MSSIGTHVSSTFCTRVASPCYVNSTRWQYLTSVNHNLPSLTMWCTQGCAFDSRVADANWFGKCGRLAVLQVYIYPDRVITLRAFRLATITWISTYYYYQKQILQRDALIMVPSHPCMKSSKKESILYICKWEYKGTLFNKNTSWYMEIRQIKIWYWHIDKYHQN